jgi:hypothetical protein
MRFSSVVYPIMALGDGHRYQRDLLKHVLA